MASNSIETSLPQDLRDLLTEYKDTTFWSGFFAGAGTTCLACLVALGLLW